MRLVNLTPHPIRFADEEGNIVAEIEPSGFVARVPTREEVWATFNLNGHAIPLVKTIFEREVQLPDPQPGVFYIVSGLVLEVAPRSDLVAPDTGPTAVRHNGQVVAIRRLRW